MILRQPVVKVWVPNMGIYKDLSILEGQVGFVVGRRVGKMVMIEMVAQCLKL
jgi:hypothetical protein